MTRIKKGNDVVTVINVFTVEPANQQRLVDLLACATDESMRHLPGFVSASIHRSLDGVRVTNYAQWRSREDFDAMLRNPMATPHMQEATALATAVDTQLYEVAEVHARQRPSIAMATGASAIGALAVGAGALGALAIGRLAIGALVMKRGRVQRLWIDDLTVGRLDVGELITNKS